jgi:ADP-ribose pyrophosphatase YjhB (NUDIX family)
MIPNWLLWARELQTIAQNGLTFSRDQYDIDRYNRIKSIAAEIISGNSNIDSKILLEAFTAQEGYSTPKVDVRGVVFKDKKILLVKEKADGKWTLPGGWADPNETPSQSVEREVFEESGFVTKTLKVLAVFDRDKQGHFPPYPYHIYKIFSLCEVTGGEPKPSNETLEVDFFHEDEIPELSSSRITLNQLKLFFKKENNKNWETEFD